MRKLKYLEIPNKSKENYNLDYNEYNNIDKNYINILNKYKNE